MSRSLAEELEELAERWGVLVGEVKRRRWHLGIYLGSIWLTALALAIIWAVWR